MASPFAPSHTATPSRAASAVAKSSSRYSAPRWFVRIQPLAEKAIAAVRDGGVRIIPEQFEKVYFHWLENIKDWCVSRQLWWGHRIPAWYGPEGQVHVDSEAPRGEGWVAETDVLDTWFSSGIWPFSSLGWPEETPDFARYYPTSVLETGYDILFFWVARMIMMGLWFTDEAPFHTVYLHGLVRDARGRKFSKVARQRHRPLELVDRFGADPLRFTLVTTGTPGKDLNLDEARIESHWRFVNKLWQIANFISSACRQGEMPPPGLPSREELDLPTRWLLSHLNTLIANVQRLFDSSQYGEAGRQIHDFLWGEFADWYVEISKHPLYQGSAAERETSLRVLLFTLDQIAAPASSFMPFVTEEIWQHLPYEGETLMLAHWPEADVSYHDAEAESQFELLMELVRGLRELRRDYEVTPGRKLTVIAAPGNPTRFATRSLSRLRAPLPRAFTSAAPRRRRTASGFHFARCRRGDALFTTGGNDRPRSRTRPPLARDRATQERRGPRCGHASQQAIRQPRPARCRPATAR